ncbi:MAG: pyruvate dehydrogenase [Rickettsiales bacterium]|nr:pyruvate dehydrogenase [Rickettsiales bacterium]
MITLSKYSNEIKEGILIRNVEEKLLELFKDGYLNGTVHTCVGQELIGVFISKYLNKNDHIVSNHRGHGHYLSRFKDIEGLIAEVMGKRSGCSGGYGGSQHLFNNNFLSNGIQGGMVPIATGIGLYYRLKNTSNISIAYIGDGTLGEGILYESLNIASKWNIPLLIVMENNRYAQSTSIDQTFAGDIKKRIQGFGIEYKKTNSIDIEHLDNTINSSINFVRKNSKPLFIEIETYRLNAHSKGDDNRSMEEIKSYQDIDLISNALSKENSDFQDYNKKIKSEIDQIVDKLKKLDNLSSIKMLEKVNLLESNFELPIEPEKDKRYNSLINKSLSRFLSANINAIIIGEDIEDGNDYVPGDYGGAFKVTKNLSQQFSGRIFNTPISEAAIVGVAAGYSIKAGRTFVELMFGDFSTLAFDQILQHISKFEMMYNGGISCPLILRTPMGGKRGYGPTHSQSIEKHFMGIPNFTIIALNHRINPDYILESLNSIKTPALLIENKILYTINTGVKKVEGYNYSYSNNLFPSLLIKPSFADALITLICYGEVLHDVELAVRKVLIEFEFPVEIVCPSLISPIDTKIIKKSVSRTKNLLIIEEGNNEAAWSSEVVTNLIENGISINNLFRFSNNNIIPSSFEAEKNLMPTKENIYNQIINFKRIL